MNVFVRLKQVENSKKNRNEIISMWSSRFSLFLSLPHLSCNQYSIVAMCLCSFLLIRNASKFFISRLIHNRRETKTIEQQTNITCTIWFVRDVVSFYMPATVFFKLVVNTIDIVGHVVNQQCLSYEWIETETNNTRLTSMLFVAIDIERSTTADKQRVSLSYLSHTKEWR
jgi:hypothetical protein